MPVLDLDMRLKYLIEYPHGCIEQITSGAFPQLFVPDLIDTVSDETARIKKNIMSVIERFPRYQTASGGFAYWPGNGDESPWGTSYAGHFLKKPVMKFPIPFSPPGFRTRKTRREPGSRTKNRTT